MEEEEPAGLRFTPLLGTGPDDPVCGLLELDGHTLLLDCGWTQACTEQHIEALARVAPRVDVVVLSHATLAHVGALPVLLARGLLPPDVVLLSTTPIKTLSVLMMQAFLAETRAISDALPFTAAQLSQLAQHPGWVLSRFYQRLELSGRGAGLVATPYAAGHTLGGAVWRLVSHAAPPPDPGASSSHAPGPPASAGHEVVYVSGWCHRKERHLAACVLPELFDRPAALLLDARSALTPQLDSTRRDAELLDLLVSTVRGADGTVLVPVEAAGRLLEVALLLDEFWAREKFDRVYPLVLVNPVGKAVAEAAQSMLEFMSDSIGKAFELRRDNPFSFRCLRLLSGLPQLSQLQPGPKVVLATSASLERGPARQLFLDLVQDERNTVCFVQRPPAGSLADQVLRHASAAAGQPPLKVAHVRRVPLEGGELEAWRQQQQLEQQQRQQQQQQQSAGDGDGGASAPGEAAAGGGAMDVDRPGDGPAGRAPGTPFSGRAPGPAPSLVSGSSMPLRSSSIRLSTLVRDVSGQLGQPQAGAVGAHLAGPGWLPPGRFGAVLMDGFEPPQGAAHAMFPDEDDGPPPVWDDYGMQVDHVKFQEAAKALSTVAVGPGGAGSTGRKDSTGRAARPGGAKQVKEEEEDDEGESGGEDSDREEGAGAGEGEDGAGAPPTKLVTEQLELAVRAAVRYFNYEGLADARILRKAVADIAPQVLVVLHGSEAARRELAGFAGRELQGFHTTVLTPAAGQAVEAPLPVSHTLYVSEALRRRFPTHELGRSGHLGAVVDAAVTDPDPHFPGLLQLVPAKGGGAARQPSGALPSPGGALLLSEASGAHEGGAGWLGDVFFADGAEGVRLSELKKALADAGIQSAWLGPGALSCGAVIISKASLYASSNQAAGGAAQDDHPAALQAGRGHLVIEGSLSEQNDDLLQRVRDVIYMQFGVTA